MGVDAMQVLGFVAGVGVLIVVGGMVWARLAGAPETLGIQNGLLAPLSGRPNGVTSQNGPADQQMDPMAFAGDREDAQARLLQVVTGMPRAEVKAVRSGYVWVVFRSAFFGFPDDVEFVIDDREKVIHFRAAARLGYSDLGVNRRRMVAIREAFEK